MKTRLLIPLFAVMICAVSASAQFLGGRAAVTNLNKTTNFFVVVMGEGTNSPIRLVAPESAWRILQGLPEYDAVSRNSGTASNLSLTGGAGVAGNLAVTGGDISTDQSITVSGTADVTGSITSGANIRVDGELQVGNKRIKLSVGNGSPEGVVTANPQSIYLNTNQTSGIGLYLKTNGTSNTGWWLLSVGGVGEVTTAQLLTVSNQVQSAQSGNQTLTNLSGTGAVTNKFNTWEVWANPSTTNLYHAANRALGITTNSVDFSALVQSIYNRGVDTPYVKIRANPYFTNAYVASNTIIITNMTIMEGEGNSTTVIRAASSLNGPVIQLGHDSGGVRNGAGGIVRINHLRFEGDAAGTNGVGVKILKAAEPVFDSTEWTGFKRAGVEVASTNDVFWSYISKCWFVNKWVSSHGVLFSATPITGLYSENHIMIFDSVFGGGGTGFITISNKFPNLQISDNHFRYSVGAAGAVAYGIGAYAAPEFAKITDNQFANFEYGSGYPIFLFDRASATNYNVTIADNSSSADGPLVVVGEYIQRVQTIGNTVRSGDAVFLSGNNASIHGFDSTGLRFSDGTTQTTASAGGSGSTNPVVLAAGFLVNSNLTFQSITNLGTNAVQGWDLFANRRARIGIFGNTTLVLTNMPSVTNAAGGGMSVSYEADVYSAPGATNLTIASLHTVTIVGDSHISSGATNTLYLKWTGTNWLARFSDVPTLGSGPWMRTRTGVRRTIVIPAGYIKTNSTQGAIAGTEETSTNKKMRDFLVFGDSANTNAVLAFVMPQAWDRGNISVQFHWGATNGSGAVVWQVAADAADNDDAVDGAFGSNVSVTDTLLATGDYHISPASGAITFGNAPGAELSELALRIRRDPGHASDTLAANAFLYYVIVQYTESTTEPAALP